MALIEYGNGPMPGEVGLSIEVDGGYEYADGLDWTPGSKLHAETLSRLLRMATASHNVMQRAYPKWRKIDRNLTAYVPLDEKEEAIKTADFRRPVSIVVPTSYAVLETLLSYYGAVFFDQMFPIEGVGPEDTVGAVLLQHDLRQQYLRANGDLYFYTQWRDALTYGIGALSPIWQTERRWVTETEPTFSKSLFGLQLPTGSQQIPVEKVVWEGHMFRNIDPYCFLPDPNCPIHEIQRMEFVGMLDRTNRAELLGEELSNSDVFNCRYLKGVSGKSMLRSDESGRNERLWGAEGIDDPGDLEGTTRPLDQLWMYVNLIPKEWNLGDSEYPEKWLFRAVNDQLIIEARPLNLEHGRYPISICAPDFDGYSILPVSRMEMIYGLQETMDWLFSSHIANVRKTMNDVLVIDPYRINQNDVYNRMSKAGGVIRTRRASWGSGVSDSIMQLPVADVTRNHVNDAGFIGSLIERVTGATDAMQGVLQQGAPERRTAEEFRAINQAARGRLEKSARLIQTMSIKPVVELMASQTIQLRGQESWVKLSGEWPMRLAQEYGVAVQQGRVSVNPKDIDVAYDIVVSTDLIDRLNDPESMLRLFEMAQGNPVIAQRVDFHRMYKNIARKLGEKNIDDFDLPIQTTVMPDEQVGNMAADGRLEAI